MILAPKLTCRWRHHPDGAHSQSMVNVFCTNCRSSVCLYKLEMYGLMLGMKVGVLADGDGCSFAVTSGVWLVQILRFRARVPGDKLKVIIANEANTNTANTEKNKTPREKSAYATLYVSNTLTHFGVWKPLVLKTSFLPKLTWI